MKKNEFIDAYCRDSKITRAEFDRRLAATPCACGEADCHGWSVLPNDAGLIATCLPIYTAAASGGTDR